MNAHELSVYLRPLIASCPLWQEKYLSVVVIANPVAGGFANKALASKHEALLSTFCAQAQLKDQLCRDITVDVVETTGAEGTTDSVKRIIKLASMPENYAREYLLITAGGDGTALEVQSALVHIALSLGSEYADVVSNRVTVLRLPFGTGNDGSDARDLADCLRLFTEPAHFAMQPAIEVTCTPSFVADKKKLGYASLHASPPWYAFNIASLGIDAYITHMTNKTKKIFPGNFYKIWIDLACLFYSNKFPSKDASVTVYDKDDKPCATVTLPLLFVLLGVSGHRTYGSNQKILPDERNVCITQNMGLIQKMLLKKQFTSGKHATCNKTHLFAGEKIVINYNEAILAQMDGEVHYIDKDAFPLTMKKTKPIIRIIERNNMPYSRGATEILL